MIRYRVGLFQKFSRFSWVFIAILLIGIFLRTYNLREWLHFGSDQERDTLLVENVVNGVTSWPLLGMEAGNTRFDLGPMHYYFQIVSGKIFGANPATMAYPDVFFSILTIPFLYLFLRRYFYKNLSLALTGLYTVSFYVVEYSRFAWNPNAIPFFVVLFLLSTLELLEAREKTRWIWVGLLGVTIGVGIQLHALLLMLLPAVSFVVFVFLLKKSWRVWSRFGAVLFIVLVLNIPPIWSDIETGGANSTLFLSAFSDRSESGGNKFLEDFQTDLLCHAQVNTHILSSLGDRSNCTFLSTWSRHKGLKGIVKYIAYLGIFFSFLFSLVGYGLLVFRARKETDPKKKQFLGLILLYFTLSFVVMFSIIRGAPLRYFIHTTFVPFILLGLILEWLGTIKLLKRWRLVLSVLVFSFLFVSNFYTIKTEASDLASGTRGSSGFAVLGEAERMVDFIIAQSSPERQANFSGGTTYVPTYYQPLRYLAQKKNFTLNLVDKKAPPVSDTPYFFIWRDAREGKSFDIDGYVLMKSKNFGQIGIYQLKRQ